MDTRTDSGEFYPGGDRRGGDPIDLTFDDAVTRTSARAVKSSGIWGAIWGTLTAVPKGFASLYDWCVAKLKAKRDYGDLSYERQDPSEGGWILRIDGTDVRLLPAGELTWTDTGSETEGTYNLKWLGQWRLAYVAGSGMATCVDQESQADATELTLVSESDYETVVATATAVSVDDSLALRSEVAKKQDRLTAQQLAAANSGATAAKVAAWDGYAAQISGKASAADLRYRIAEAGYDSQSAVYTLADRAVNLITATDETSIDIKLPADVRVDGVRRARDFFLDVDNSANASDLALEYTELGNQYGFVAGADDSIGEMMTIAKGERARLYFSETSWGQYEYGVFHVARVTLGDLVDSIPTTQGGN